MRSSPLITPGWASALALATGLALAGCASSPTGSVTPALVSGADPSKEFGACSQPGQIDSENLLPYLARLTPWRQVSEITGTEPYDQPNPDPLLTLTYDDANGKSRTALMSETQLAGVRWGVANDADVWLGIESPAGQDYPAEHVGTPMVLTRDDDVFFSGDCADDMISEPVRTTFDDAAAVMRELVTASPTEARELLGVDAG